MKVLYLCVLGLLAYIIYALVSPTPPAAKPAPSPTPPPAPVVAATPAWEPLTIPASFVGRYTGDRTMNSLAVKAKSLPPEQQIQVTDALGDVLEIRATGVFATPRLSALFGQTVVSVNGQAVILETPGSVRNTITLDATGIWVTFDSLSGLRLRYLRAR